MNTNKHELFFGEVVYQMVGFGSLDIQTKQQPMGENCLMNNIGVHSCSLVVPS